MSKLHRLIPLALAAALSLAGCAAASSASTADSSSSPASGQDSGGSGGNDKVATKKKSEPGIGDPVRDGKFEFTVTKVRKGVKSVGSDMFGQKAQGQFILVSVKVENIGKKSQDFTAAGQKLYDQTDREFDADSTAAIYIESSNSLYTPINPGNAVRGVIVFDVPKNVTPTKLELHDSVFSGGTEVML